MGSLITRDRVPKQTLQLTDMNLQRIADKIHEINVFARQQWSYKHAQALYVKICELGDSFMSIADLQYSIEYKAQKSLDIYDNCYSENLEDLEDCYHDIFACIYRPLITNIIKHFNCTKIHEFIIENEALTAQFTLPPPYAQ